MELNAKATPMEAIVNTKELPFLDPLQDCTIRAGSLKFKSVESLFLASAFQDSEIRLKFTEFDGYEAREAFLKLMEIKVPVRPDFFRETTNKGRGVVKGYLELLRRCWFLRFMQDPEAARALVDTGYRPIQIRLQDQDPKKSGPSSWLGDQYLSEVLTVVRAQLRDAEELDLLGVVGPGADNQLDTKQSEPEAAVTTGA